MDRQRNQLKLVARTLLETIHNGDYSFHESTEDTPRRFAEAWEFWTSGYDQKPDDVLKTFESSQYNEMVFQGNIPVWSMCEHHLAPFFGIAHIGYIPFGKVYGLSKLSRLVDVFARRLQTQERLTQEIANALFYHMTTNQNVQSMSVGVVLRCRHTCMESRGVEKSGTVTYTSALRGSFKTDVSARAEFMGFVQRADAQSRI